MALQLPQDPDRTLGALDPESDALRSFVRSLGLTADQADDCLAETVSRLWVALDRGDPIRDPRAWSFRTAYRVAMDEHRRARRLRSLSEIHERLPQHATDEMDQVDHRIALTDLVDRLPSRRRQVVRLRYFADLSFEGISTVLGISPSAARSHATFAMTDLRQMLAGASKPGDRSGIPISIAPSLVTIGRLERPPGGLIEPAGMDVAPDGRIWVVDTGQNTLAVFDQSGAFLHRCGAAGHAPGRFWFQRVLGNTGDVRFAPNGSFYVADTGNKRVQWFDPDGVLRGWWGRPGRGDGEFLDPWSVRFDRSGNVYVSDGVREDVQVFTPEGRYLRTIGGPGRLDFQGDAQVVGDQLLVADHGHGRIVTFGDDGRAGRAFGQGSLDGPDGLDVLPDGRLIVADSRAGRFVLFGQDGMPVGAWPGDAWMVRALPDGRILTSGHHGVQIHRIADPAELLGTVGER